MALQRLAIGERGAPAAPPRPPAAAVAATDLVRALEHACARLQQARPRTLAAYRACQSSQALLAGGLRLAAALPAAPPLLALVECLLPLAAAHPPGIVAGPRAAVAASVLRLAPAFGSLPTPYRLGTAHAVVQLRSDAVYLATAAAHPAAGGPPPGGPPNRVAAAALALVCVADAGGRGAGPDTGVATALRLIGANLLGLAANAGGAEMAPEAQARAAGLVATYGAVLRGQESLPRAGAALTAGLRAFVAALVRATGGSHGTRHALAALMADIATLDIAVRQRLGGFGPSL